MGYGVVWDERLGKISLRFKYLDGLYENQIVGTQFLGDDPLTVEEEIKDRNATAAREAIMRKTLNLGIKGWYGMKMTDFWRQQVVPNNQLFQKFKGVRWDL